MQTNIFNNNHYNNNIHTFFEAPLDFEMPFMRKQSFCSLFANEQFINNELSWQQQDFRSIDMQFNEFNYIDTGFVQNYESESAQKFTTENKESTDAVENLPVKPVTKINMTKKTAHNKAPKKFYEKNICRNIIRKAIRSIESRTYDEELKNMSALHGFDAQEFRQIMIANVEQISGPAALKEFLKPEDEVSKIFKVFLVWFLKERYIRQALREGHMKDIQKYVEYKNTILLPLLN